jgi:hypothetical protein
VYEAAVRAVVILLFSLASLTLLRPAMAADPRIEASARDAINKAQVDYQGLNYGTGAARLRKALKACGANKCSAAVRASLLRDLGAMQFRKGELDGANKSWAGAVKLQPGIALTPAYDAADLRSAFEAATGGGGGGGGRGGGGGGSSAPAAGDFTHMPAIEQKVNTPLPVYVEGGPEEVKAVVVKYKSATMSEWRRVDLDKVGDGWGGLIPCSDVTSGTMRYYIQGLNKNKEPIANSGDAKHPFTVPIRDEISGEEPRLPGMKAPKQCGGAGADCPPDFPGCGKGKGADEDSGEKTESEGEQKEGEGDNADKGEGAPHKKKFRRFWLGIVPINFTFMHLPGGTNVCRLNPIGSPNPGLPYNTLDYYCTNQDGSDFPTRNDSTGAQNSMLRPGTSGNVNDQWALANWRLLVSFDVAVTGNVLVGLRLGAVLGDTYPGGSPSLGPTDSKNAAVHDGKASSLGALHAEVRGTYLFGTDPLVRGLAPMVIAGGGVSEFDVHTTDRVGLYVAGSNTMLAQPPRTVNIWRTGGPGFLMLGAGVRWGVDRFGVTAAARLDIALGGNGAIPAIGPEVAVQFGF